MPTSFGVRKAAGRVPCSQRLSGFLLAVAAPFRAQRVRTEEARIVGWLCRRLVTEVDRQPDASQRRVIVERTVHCEAVKDHHVSDLKVRRQQTGLTRADELQRVGSTGLVSGVLCDVECSRVGLQCCRADRANQFFKAMGVLDDNERPVADGNFPEGQPASHDSRCSTRKERIVVMQVGRVSEGRRSQEEVIVWPGWSIKH